MRVDEIVLGILTSEGPRTHTITPEPWGLTVVPVPPEAGAPEPVAAALREVLTARVRRTLTEALPFLRITATEGERELAIADDATGAGRMMTVAARGDVVETHEAPPEAAKSPEARSPAARPKTGKAGSSDAARPRSVALEDAEEPIEALLAAVARFADAEDPTALAAALEHAPDLAQGPATSQAIAVSRQTRDLRTCLGPRPAGTASPQTEPSEDAASREGAAFVAALDRARRLAAEVRAIDERITASVVPDWLWVATGLGGVGVVMAVVALLYPGLQAQVVPALVVVAILGLGAYVARARREVAARSLLLASRRELRSHRERARQEAESLRARLEAAGRDPDAILLGAARVPSALPLLVGRDELDAEQRRALEAAARARQVIVLVRGA